MDLSPERRLALLTIAPPEYRAWADQAGLPGVRGERAVREDPGVRGPASAIAHVSHTPLTIANPPAGAIYSIDPTLRREFQALPLRVVTPAPTSVQWLVDGMPIGTASSESSLSWPLAVGSHEIEARDSRGRSARTRIVVK